MCCWKQFAFSESGEDEKLLYADELFEAMLPVGAGVPLVRSMLSRHHQSRSTVSVAYKPGG